MDYLCGRESCSRMTLCHTSMQGESFGTEYLCSQNAVTDVRLCAVTIYGRRIDPNATDVVQHGGFPKESLVYLQFRMRSCNLQGSPRHIRTMPKQYLLKWFVAFAILVYQFIYHFPPQNYTKK